MALSLPLTWQIPGSVQKESVLLDLPLAAGRGGTQLRTGEPPRGAQPKLLCHRIIR